MYTSSPTYHHPEFAYPTYATPQFPTVTAPTACIAHFIVASFTYISTGCTQKRHLLYGYRVLTELEVSLV
jgi:hypothetical protein